MIDRLQLQIPCQLRKPLQLFAKSCHLHLSSLAFQTAPQQVKSLQDALKALGEAYETRDLGGLFRCTVGLTRADGRTDTVILSSANTQLHALNIDADGFKYGYEPEISAVIDFFVGDDGALVDVGANFGYFPIYLASRKGFHGTIYAFEPSRRGFVDLEQLVTAFGLGEHIKIYQCALGDRAGQTELFLSNSDGLTTMIASMASRLETVVSKHTVQVARLDDFPIEKIDLIKIDVEGAETMVIAGGLEAIKACTPVVIFESWISTDDRQAFAGLQERGYQFFVPTWKNQNGHMSTSINEALDPAALLLIAFHVSERRNLSDRINVVAIHRDRLLELKAYSVASTISGQSTLGSKTSM